jgi:hypothetical protein
LEQAADYLREVFVWIGQRYGNGMGLAGPTASPETEVQQAIGRAVPQRIQIERRGESYLSSVVLDLCAFLRLERLYGFAREDFRRIDVSLSAMTTADTVGQYLLDGTGVAIEINASYADALSDDWAGAAPHLAGEAFPRYLQSLHRSWDHLAVSAVLRDRHFVCAWPALML